MNCKWELPHGCHNLNHLEGIWKRSGPAEQNGLQSHIFGGETPAARPVKNRTGCAVTLPLK